MPEKTFLSAGTMLSMVFVANGVHAQNLSSPWTVRGDFQALASSYSSSLRRDALQNFGLFIHADYLDSGGVTVGYNRTVLGFVNDDPDIDQDNIFLSGRWNLTPDWAQGRITLRLDSHVISNNDPTNETDDVTTIAPQISFLNYAQTFSADIGYSVSTYGDSLLTGESLDVNQLTPTIGFAFNEQRDWLQLRAYLIEPSNLQRAQNQEDTAALEVKWTHWPMARGFLGLESFRVSAMFGERLYGVDSDAGGSYNLVDMQTGGASIGGEWVLNDTNRLLLLLGAEEYQNPTINEDYRNAFIYLNFTHIWD